MHKLRIHNLLINLLASSFLRQETNSRVSMYLCSTETLSSWLTTSVFKDFMKCNKAFKFEASGMLRFFSMLTIPFLFRVESAYSTQKREQGNDVFDNLRTIIFDGRAIIFVDCFANRYALLFPFHLQAHHVIHILEVIKGINVRHKKPFGLLEGD